MDVRYGALLRSVTVFPLKTRFRNTSAAILMYFVNTTLKFSAIIDGKFKLRSSVKVMLLFRECLVFERFDSKPDQIYLFVSL